MATLTPDTVLDPRTQRSWQVSVLRRQPDESWLIWKRMWGDLR